VPRQDRAGAEQALSGVTPAGAAAQPSFRVIFAVFFCVSLTSAVGTTAMQSLLPAIGRSTGIADNLIVTISSLSALLHVVSAPFWAYQTDRLGQRRVVLIGVAGVGLSMLATGAAVLAGVHKLYGPGLVLLSLIAARSVFGLVGLASHPAVQAYVARNTRPEERTNAIALLASAMGIGSIVGPALAPLLIFPVLSLAGPFFLFSLVSAVVYVLVVLKVPRDAGEDRRAAIADPKPRPKAWPTLSDPAVFPFVIYGVVISFAASSALQTLGFIVIDRRRLEPVEAARFAGVAMMAGAMAVLVAQWGLIRMLKMTPRSLLLWGAALAGIGSLMQAFGSSFQAIVLAFALANLGFGFARPGFTAGASLVVSADKQALVAGALGSVNAIGLIIGPITALTLYQLYRPAPFLLSAAAMAGLMIYCRVSPVLRNAGPSEPVSEAVIEQTTSDDRG
jgi:MFS family permease